MRSLAAYAETTGNRELAGRDLAKWVGQIGLIESRAGSKAFSQLYAALALRHFGRDLKTNPLWQGLSPEEQKAWRSLLNPERFYDPANRVINLPDNYLGVAARIASISYELGISNDRAFLDKLLDRAAVQFTEAIFTPTIRRRRDVTIVTQTSTRATSGKRRRSPGVRIFSIKCGHRCWSRCVCGGMSFRKMDTVTTGGAAGAWSVISTRPRSQVFSRRILSSGPRRSLTSPRCITRRGITCCTTIAATHLLSIFAFGRGNYAYISREREWQQTTGFFRQACRLAHAVDERVGEGRCRDVSGCAGAA